MSSEWKRIKVRDLGRIVTGKTPHTSRKDFFGGLIPFLTPTDMPDGQKHVGTERTLTDAGLATVKNCLIPKGVAVSCIGWKMGKSVLIEERTVTNQQINTVVVDESRFDLPFVYYLLSSMRPQIFELGATPTRTPIVNKSNFGNIDIAVPALPLQQEISRLGTALDDRITLVRATNATLEAIAQALFKSWFVDFDPVRAKLEGRAPEGMDEATAALFPDGFEESALGLVPRGWRTQSFRETIQIIGGGTPKTSNPDYWNGEIPWFSVVDAPAISDVFVLDTEKRITEAGLNGSSTKLLTVGTTIISARGTVGRLALTGRPMAMNQSCYGLRGLAGDSYFTYFSTKRLVEQLKQRAHGSVFDTITQESFAGVLVSLPSEGVIAGFEDSVEALMLRIRENLLQAQTLATLRDTLLPRLISGQLRLPDVELQFQEAAK
jgi:type I restriction enzyme, S subunit